MRSRIGSCLILLICAGIFPALASCGGRAVDQHDHDNRSQLSSSAAVTSVARPTASPTVPHSAPATDSLHFDLYCELDGHVVADPHPNEIIGTYPANVRTWRYAAHFIVDLQAMQVCDSSACEQYGPFRISANPERITLQDVPGATIFISRRNWRYDQRQDNMGRVSVTRGRCVPARFSGIPVGARPAG